MPLGDQLTRYGDINDVRYGRGEEERVTHPVKDVPDQERKQLVIKTVNI